MHLTKLFFKNEGQTIIEAVVALALVVVILTAISISVISSVNNSEFIKDQSLASKYAQQGMEYLRSLRNNPPADPNQTFDHYATTNTTYCMDINNALSPMSPCSSVSSFSNVQFIREVVFSPANVAVCAGGTRVAINVYWADGKCSSATTATRYCHKAQIVSCLSNPSSSGGQL